MKKTSIYILSIILLSFLFFSCFQSGNDKSPGTDISIDSVSKDVSQLVFSNQKEWTYNITMYEVNVRQYTPEGNFKAFEAHLQRLQDMGVGVLWFMPIQPIGIVNRLGSLGSYYSVKDYEAVNPEFGNMADFKQLVQKAHEKGMYVIIDWVANHTSWDNTLTKTHPEFYVTNASGKFIPPPGTNWTDVIELDYTKAELRNYMINTLKKWVTETHIDGFRFDAVDFVPAQFWQTATDSLRKLKPDIFLLAEGNGIVNHTNGFDMDYCWEICGWGNGLSKRIYEQTATATELNNFLNTEKSLYMPDKYRMYFTSNHDDNSWNGTVSEQLGESAKLWAVFVHTFSGMPLIYCGQEAGLNKRLLFFDKDPISWDNLGYEDLYKKLNLLRKNNPALWSGNAGGVPKRITTNLDSKIFAFSREKDAHKVVVILNLSNSAQNIKITEAAALGEYADIFSESDFSLTSETNLQLGAWGYLVLAK